MSVARVLPMEDDLLSWGLQGPGAEDVVHVGLVCGKVEGCMVAMSTAIGSKKCPEQELAGISATAQLLGSWVACDGVDVMLWW